MFHGVLNTGKKWDDEFRVPPLRRYAVRFFGKILSGHVNQESMERNLRKAKMGMSGVEFYSEAILYSIIFGAALVAIDSVLLHIFPALILIITSASFLAIMAFVALFLELPVNVVRVRRKKIDSILTVTIGYFATMASADIPVDLIFRDLGESRQYGEVSREARSIWLRTSVFGQDIMSSIREAAKNSPSQRFSDFLQGIITSVNSGGDLKSYFTSKAQQFQEELRSRIRQNSDSMGILAESFVTVGVAFPLILMIIVGVIAFLSPVPPAGYIVILIFTVAVIIPALLGIFAYFFGSTEGEIEL
ncbi:MAG: type II secretion system F family protein [Thermoplasmataceae archaeon]